MKRKTFFCRQGIELKVENWLKDLHWHRAVWEALGGFGEAWGGFGSFWSLKINLGATFGRLWETLGDSGGAFGEALGGFGELWETLGESLGSLWEALGKLWESFRAFLLLTPSLPSLYISPRVSPKASQRWPQD